MQLMQPSPPTRWKGCEVVFVLAVANTSHATQVVEPMMNGIGGDIMTMLWHNATRKLYGYNGSGRSPKVSSTYPHH
jgi:gamma-glutamyltranspeptidase